jgi:hypothetical protein
MIYSTHIPPQLEKNSSLEINNEKGKEKFFRDGIRCRRKRRRSKIQEAKKEELDMVKRHENI